MDKVLLVDDEPLVLAGIRMMIPWETLACEWVGNARNGEQALEAMHTLHPDIVIADISMPVMDGIALLKAAETQFPATVFIMLTNLQEFHLAQDSLRHRATDYLIKSQLEPEVLVASLTRAKEEAERRRKMLHMHRATETRQNDTLLHAQQGWQQLYITREMPEAAATACDAIGIWARYRILEISFRFPERLLLATAEEGALASLGEWGGAIAREVAQRCFAHVLDIETGYAQQHLITLLIWGDDTALSGDAIQVFRRKLDAATGKIAGLSPMLLVSPPFSGADSAARVQPLMARLKRRQYLDGETLLLAENEALPPDEAAPLALSGIASRMRTELTGRNTPTIRQLFQRVDTAIVGTRHDRSEALWLVSELYTAVQDTLGSMTATKSLLPETKTGYAQIACLLTAKDVSAYLSRLEGIVLSLLEDSSTRQDIVIESVKQYVQDHIGERITLQDAAQASCISAGYLSSMFKKQTGESFMGYINRVKVERACTLIGEGADRVGQLGWMLGFENAYYFTRVFKRYMGMTPSEYIEQVQSSK